MKKNGISFLLTELFLVSVLAGCGQNTTDNQVVEQNTEIEQEVSQTVEDVQESNVLETAEPTDEVKMVGTLTEEAFQLEIKGTTISLGGDMIAYQQEIGEPDDYSAAKSCLGTGEDKSFTYGGVTIYTKPIDQMDKIFLIELTGEEALAGGIAVGSSKADVIAAYGEDYELEGTEFFYTMEEKTLGIDIQNDEVTFIEIFGE